LFKSSKQASDDLGGRHIPVPVTYRKVHLRQTRLVEPRRVQLELTDYFKSITQFPSSTSEFDHYCRPIGIPQLCAGRLPPPSIPHPRLRPIGTPRPSLGAFCHRRHHHFYASMGPCSTNYLEPSKEEILFLIGNTWHPSVTYERTLFVLRSLCAVVPRQPVIVSRINPNEVPNCLFR